MDMELALKGSSYDIYEKLQKRRWGAQWSFSGEKSREIHRENASGTPFFGRWFSLMNRSQLSKRMCERVHRNAFGGTMPNYTLIELL